MNIEDIEKNIERIEKDIQNIENRSDFTGDKPRYKDLIDRLDKARADLDKANHRLDMANERLKEGVDYRLQLKQLLNIGSYSIVAPTLIVWPSQASFTSVGGSYWHSSPINHRIAFEALTMMEAENVEKTCFDLYAKEILETQILTWTRLAYSLIIGRLMKIYIDDGYAYGNHGKDAGVIGKWVAMV